MDVSKLWNNLENRGKNPFSSVIELIEFLKVADQLREAMIKRGTITWD